jgi:protein-S-isoprenylcysteine O-methyltransferase Ste14
MIGYAADVLLIILGFIIFGAVHSFLASTGIKKTLIKKIGSYIAFYRIAYNIFSLLFLYLLYKISPKPDIIIYDLDYPFDFVILVPQFFGLAGFIWTLRYVCIKEFLGLDQIKRWLIAQYDTNELDERLTLRIRGPYRFTRHPLYFFSIMFLVFRPVMDLFYLTILLCIIAYFFVGSFYEEKKLVQHFGEKYEKYQKAVPRIIPVKFFKPFKVS